MREIARAKQGFFPTQSRIVRAVANLFKLPRQSSGAITVLDAGCGTGAAIHDLRNHWLKHQPPLRVNLLGIESDRTRCEQAAKVLDSSLWSPIEDSYPDGGVSLLWFNPPYDRIRGAGRTELALFNKVREWPARSTGLLLMIVPDHVLADPEVGLATAVERDFELLGLWRYPEPEYCNSEQALFLRLLERMDAGGLLVADRAFGSFLQCCRVQFRGSHLLARLRKDRQGKKLKSLGYRDKLVEWKRPQPKDSAFPEFLAECPPRIYVRVIERSMQRAGFRTWKLLLVTTLLEPRVVLGSGVLQRFRRSRDNGRSQRSPRLRRIQILPPRQRG